MPSDPFIGKNFGSYRVTSLIASGGFGAVYKGQHTFLSERTVAIKVLRSILLGSQQEHDKFLQEAQILEKLKHPYILPILDVGIQDDIPFLIIEYASQGSLQDRLNRQQLRLLPPSEALNILSQVGQALQFAHQQHVIHRDLKPANILFNTKGDTLLADFGVATALATASVKYVDTVGTPAYMAPEQFRGMISKESDQYALGCIAYELFTGSRPFNASDFVAMGFKHATESPVAPRQLNPQMPVYVEQTLLKAMAKERKDRFPDVAAFIAALQPAHEIHISVPPQMGQPVRPQPPVISFPPQQQRSIVTPYQVQSLPVVMLPPPQQQPLIVTPPQGQLQGKQPGSVNTTDPFNAITADTKRSAGLVYLVLLLVVELATFIIVPLTYPVFSIIVLSQHDTKKPSRFKRFHTMQSVLLGGVNLLGWVGVVICFSAIIASASNNTVASPIYAIPLLVGFLLFISSIIMSFIAIVGAFRGKYTKLPFLWKRAEKFADRGRDVMMKQSLP